MDGRMRCPVCKGREGACLCPRLPRIRPRTPLLIFQQEREVRSFSGTGSLAHLVLEGSLLVPYGDRSRPLDRELVESLRADSSTAWAVLYPSAGSSELAEFAAGIAEAHRPGLLILDGTWSQARKMAQRIPGLATLPFVRLPAGELPAPSLPLRKPPRPEWLSTAEAIARALEILDEPEPAALLREALEIVSRRVLAVRGKIVTRRPRPRS